MLTVLEVVERLKVEGITSSRQMVQRWVREGKIEAEKPQRRKDGYRVSEESLEKFIVSWKEKHTKRTAAECEAEIQRLKEELERSQTENARLREELERAEERNSVLTRDLFDALDKLEGQKKEQAVNWKRKYDQLLKSAQERAGRLIAAEQEIHLLKKQLQDLREQKPSPVPDEPAFTERFQFDKK
ncbi:helix-turn-helix domain-containing protein [Brevibacillus composti]|uniref:Helix-turn-helix domain-containing protein n=1 Tax=Brevibacillus composti TaxID=2796470 RepID=A0A7T5JPM5_9BACL|nr:helix-turn-helix domain-containing protein [Brevibacillus composti]QQE75241.1 helix-turn-helix domain-containing protein [Brevibacillus composti]